MVQMVQNGLKWFKMVQNGSKWFANNSNGGGEWTEDLLNHKMERTSTEFEQFMNGGRRMCGLPCSVQ